MKERLQLFMDYEHLSPSRFAEIIEVQRSSISHILSGRNNPSYDFILKVLKAFPYLNSSWLLLGKGNMLDPEVLGASDDLFSGFGSTGNSESNLFKAVSAPAERQVEPAMGKLENDNEGIPVVDKHMRKDKKGDSPAGVEKIVIFFEDKTFSVYHPEG